jgi:hypothetical protein
MALTHPKFSVSATDIGCLGKLGQGVEFFLDFFLKKIELINSLIFKLLSLSKGLNARRKEGVSKQGKSRTARIIIIKLF